ncbi:translation initiation factor SUI1 [Dipodascopsis tothii]|uniref:translation initiation factor SUI1 n=1 Tax=Dipodascopsis tothii TaxID=44089 RepID=UPI0034CD6C0C
MESRSFTYCAICSFPPEYCEFSGKFKKCKEWLEKAHPDLFQRLYSEESLTAATADMSLETKEKVEREIQKMQAKEANKAEKEMKRMMASKVIIKRVERSKRKHVIEISGLEVFGIDLKKLSKKFSSSFATGASVTKNPEGKEEIVVQGDVGDEVEDLISEMLEENGLDAVKIERTEVKPKKKGTS